VSAQAEPVADSRITRRIFSGSFVGRAGIVLVLAIAAVVLLAALKDVQPALQATLNGLVTGSYLALAAVGLTFIYGILRLINFAQGDFLTFAAYMALLLPHLVPGAPLLPSMLFAVAATAALAVVLELGLWRPLRQRGAGSLELILSTIGLAFVIRYSIQLFAGADLRQLPVDVTSSYTLPQGVTIGRTIAITTVASYLILVLVGLVLRYTRWGKQMRALADSLELAETSGLNTRRLVVAVWAAGAGCAGLAGLFYVASIGSFSPQFGFALLLPLFAAILVGGAGNPYGALAGGVLLGVVQEWSTLFIGTGWKAVVVFGVLLLTLIVRPQGLFTTATRT
jgi:neutral amino acid transport system permease protein